MLTLLVASPITHSCILGREVFKIFTSARLSVAFLRHEGGIDLVDLLAVSLRSFFLFGCEQLFRSGKSFGSLPDGVSKAFLDY